MSYQHITLINYQFKFHFLYHVLLVLFAEHMMSKFQLNFLNYNVIFIKHLNTY